MAVLLNGCIVTPVSSYWVNPHTTIRSARISGTVLDERTHAPIADAKIFLTQHPKVACKSDSSGHFELKGIRNWHWASVGDPGGGVGDVPSGEIWDPNITVSHTNYQPRQIDWFKDQDVVLLKELKLNP